jgi:hypothetical protein
MRGFACSVYSIDPKYTIHQVCNDISAMDDLDLPLVVQLNPLSIRELGHSCRHENSSRPKPSLPSPHRKRKVFWATCATVSQTGNPTRRRLSQASIDCSATLSEPCATCSGEIPEGRKLSVVRQLTQKVSRQLNFDRACGRLDASQWYCQ